MGVGFPRTPYPTKHYTQSTKPSIKVTAAYLHLDKSDLTNWAKTEETYIFKAFSHQLRQWYSTTRFDLWIRLPRGGTDP